MRNILEENRIRKFKLIALNTVNCVLSPILKGISIKPKFILRFIPRFILNLY